MAFIDIDTSKVKTPWYGSYEDIPKHLDYPDYSLYESIRRVCEKFSENIAYDYFNRKVTFKHFLKDIDTAAKSYVAIGVKKGDKVTIVMPNTPEAIISFYALNKIFYTQRDELAKLKEDFGKNTGVDGKYIDSYAKKENKNKKDDGRRDIEAKYGIKEKYYKDEKGNEKIKKETHYGYRIHLMADVDYELPIDYEIETANVAEGKTYRDMLDKKENKAKIRGSSRVILS